VCLLHFQPAVHAHICAVPSVHPSVVCFWVVAGCASRLVFASAVATPSLGLPPRLLLCTCVTFWACVAGFGFFLLLWPPVCGIAAVLLALCVLSPCCFHVHGAASWAFLFSGACQFLPLRLGRRDDCRSVRCNAICSCGMGLTSHGRFPALWLCVSH
jgi:hypothetical protein